MKQPLIIGTNSFVAAIEPLTGQELWRTKLRDGILGGSRGSDVSVLVQENIVYAGCLGRLHAINLSDGSVIWNNELKGLGYNDISLAVNGVSVQYITRTEHMHSGSSS